MTGLEKILFCGGLYHGLLVLFHLGFWKIFRWKEDLRSLSFINRQVMPILNLCLTLTFVMFGFISLVFAQDLLTTSLGHALLLFLALFWLFRTVLQVIYFGVRRLDSLAFVVFFALGVGLYAVPFVKVVYP